MLWWLTAHGDPRLWDPDSTRGQGWARVGEGRLGPSGTHVPAGLCLASLLSWALGAEVGPETGEPHGGPGAGMHGCCRGGHAEAKALAPRPPGVPPARTRVYTPELKTLKHSLWPQVSIRNGFPRLRHWCGCYLYTLDLTTCYMFF